MKRFNLEEAIAGKPVVTRNGHPVRILCVDRRGMEFPIIALMDTGTQEIVMAYTKEGCRVYNNSISENDLVMASEKKEGWVNLYITENSFAEVDTVIYESEERALLNKDTDKQYISTVKINWEE